MRTHHHEDAGHALTTYAVEDGTVPSPSLCSMGSGLNFISRLETADMCFGEHVGPLSLKCAFGGEEFYRSGRSRFVVDDSRFLILNDGQKYESSIERAARMESFCVWFKPGFARETLSALSTQNDVILDQGSKAPTGDVPFHDRTYPHDPHITPIVSEMRQAAIEDRLSGELLEEMFHSLMANLLRLNCEVRDEVERIPALRASTRRELYRRLYRARDFLDATLANPVKLSEAARIAELSPHYFLRQFQQVFGESPREYQSRRRMEKARRLLIESDAPVTHICFEVGFESLGSFSWDFRKRYGAPPSAFRRETRGPG